MLYSFTYYISNDQINEPMYHFILSFSLSDWLIICSLWFLIWILLNYKIVSTTVRLSSVCNYLLIIYFYNLIFRRRKNIEEKYWCYYPIRRKRYGSDAPHPSYYHYTTRYNDNRMDGEHLSHIFSVLLDNNINISLLYFFGA